MEVLLQVPAIFFIVIVLLNIMSSVFFSVSPMRKIKTYRMSIRYYHLFYLTMAVGYLGLITWSGIPILLALTNSLFILALYFLKYGLLWRKENFNQHIQNDKYVHLNILVTVFVTIFIFEFFESEKFYVALLSNINMSVIVLSCIKHLSISERGLSKGESVMKIALIIGATFAALPWIPLFLTGNLILHATSIFVLMSSFTLISFGSLLNLLLSDIIVFHYKNSVTDPMTGLNNRRFFLEQSKAILKSSKRYDSPISLIMCDLDKFKSINDSFGHEVGDKVIITFGEILKQCVRDGDVLSRFGGEEFIILLPLTSLDGAQKLAERIRQNAESTHIKNQEEKVYFTASFGVTSFIKSDDIEDNIRQADNALYRAKENGRNQVCNFEAIAL